MGKNTKDIMHMMTIVTMVVTLNGLYKLGIFIKLTKNYLSQLFFMMKHMNEAQNKNTDHV